MISRTNFFFFIPFLLIGCSNANLPDKINRFELVNRHLPLNVEADHLSPFTVGNGEFAFTVDVTGLQTISDYYESGIPLAMQSQWAWHSFPDTMDFQNKENFEYVETYGREVPYSSNVESEASKYLRSNPHRLYLGRIGFKRPGSEDRDFQEKDISNIHQLLDIWQGIIKSSFLLEGRQIEVETCVHPKKDQVSVRIESEELGKAPLGIGFDFPYGSGEWGKSAYDWENPSKHSTTIIEEGENFVKLRRQLDTTVYFVDINWVGSARFISQGNHHYILEINEKEGFEFSYLTSLDSLNKPVGVTASIDLTKKYWETFWLSGGAVDLSESSHPDAFELERRVVLSQYLLAIQCSGSLPPQETGLTVNSWFGKFHLEMHWWHAVHFALWDRPEMLERSMSWYESIMPVARQKAEFQGYDGVRWPKMTSPDGKDSPSNVGVFLIWQQAHPIYFAELLYRSNPTEEILERYKEIVFQSAAFMANYAVWDKQESRYVLGPPLIPAQEIYKPHETMNPPFELSYWLYGLNTAQQWRERLGLEREKKWDHVIGHLSSLAVSGGLYQNTETAMNTFQDSFHRNDHPTLLGSYGMLPNEGIDEEIMRRTLEEVMVSWNWKRTWGWDYPLTAMTAARVGRQDLAIEALLMDVEKNTYLNNGHNYQSDRLPLYLPGNGGLLTAIAMMAAGWDGCPNVHAPGFPADGTWIVKYEGLKKMP